MNNVTSIIFFFTNNIEVWSYKKTDLYTRYKTTDGQFIQNGLGQLYEVDKSKDKRVVG